MIETKDQSMAAAGEIDELIPPPGPRARGLILWVVFLGLSVLSIASVVTGVTMPQMGNSQITGWGGTGPVHLDLLLENNSPVSIEIVQGPEVPNGMKLLGYERAEYTDGLEAPSSFNAVFPLELDPGDYASVRGWYSVVDCDALPDEQEAFSVSVGTKIVSGPASVIEYDRNLMSNPDDAPNWVSPAVQFVC